MAAYASPSNDAANAGLPVRKRPYGMSDADVTATLVDMARYIREGGQTPSVRKIADVAVSARYPRSDTPTNRQIVQALLDYVRANVRYRPDMPLTEYVQAAPITLCAEGAPICIPVEDCDGLVVALASLIRSYGIEVRVLMQDYGPQQEMHVLVLFATEDGSWLTADPSSKTRPIGPKDSAIREIVMDPLNPQDLQLPPADYVTLGRPRDFAHIADAVLHTTLGKPCCQACAEGKPCTGCGSTVHPCPCETGQTLGRRPMFNELGAAAGTATGPDFTRALVDINQMSLTIQQAAKTQDLAGAVRMYQQAGNLGAVTIGPEIDAAGVPNITQSYTQQAWKLNQQLAAIDVANAASTIDVTNADTLAKSMLALYQGAVAAGQNPSSYTAPAGSNSSALGTVAVAAVVGGIGWGLWRLYSKRGR